MAKKAQSPLSLNYIKVRMYIGVLAMLLPFVVLLGDRIFFANKELQPSISAYYHTGMQYYFVFTLFAIGLFMVLYQGYNSLEMWLARAAGIAAFLTALFPTAPKDVNKANPPIFSMIAADLSVESSWQIYEIVHLTSASIMFGMIAIFSLVFFTKGGNRKPTNEKVRRNRIYRTCGIAMFVFIPFMVVSSITEIEWGVFVGELLSLMAFGIAWAVKGELFWKDATKHRDSERFNKLQARHVRGYKDGMGYIVAILALWFTILLFDAGTAPFSTVLKDEKGDEAASAASAQVTTVLNEDGQGDAALVPAVQILNPEVLSELCYPPDDEIKEWEKALKEANNDEQKKKNAQEEAQKSNECFKYLVNSRVQTELKFANISDTDDIPLTFDALYLTACKQATEEGCFQVGEDATIPDNDYLTLEISFPKEEITGELEIVGGNTISKIPISVKELSEEELAIIKDSETPAKETLAYSKTEARNALRAILFVLIWAFFFLILNYQVLPRLWPLVRRHFWIELKNDEKGEKKQLWTLFSDLINELPGGTGFSINPISETKISPPETVAPADSYLKTFFDVVSWIFPNLGYSLQMEKMSSNILGPGFSFAIVKNIGKDVIAEKIFWAQAYSIKEDNKENANDLYVYKCLMIPAFYWFSQKVDEMDGFLPEENAWRAKSYYHLGNMVWHSKPDQAINFYSRCVSQDHNNAPANNALGRIWTEKGQNKIKKIEKEQNKSKKKEIKDEALEYYLLANGYLSTAIKILKAKEGPEPAYFAALYNQVVSWIYLQELKNLKIKDKKKKLKEILKQCKKIRKWAICVLWHYKTNPKVNLNFPLEYSKEMVDELQNLTDDDIQKLKKISPAAFLIDFLALLEFVIQSLKLDLKFNDEIKKGQNLGAIESWLTNVLEKHFNTLPGQAGTMAMDKTGEGKHFMRYHYRVQYNAACFYSLLAKKASKFNKNGKKLPYANLALDHLEMALSVGGGIRNLAKEDSTLAFIRNKPRFIAITSKDEKPQEKQSHDRMVYRSTTKRWANQRIGDKDDIIVHPSKAEANKVAEEIVKNQGGGKLIVFDSKGNVKPEVISIEADTDNKKGQ